MNTVNAKKSTGSISKETYRTVVSYVFSFFLSLFLLFMVIGSVLWSALFSDRYFYRVLGDDYYAYVLRDIVTAAQDYSIPAEIDISVIDGVFTADMVRQDVDGYINAAFHGTEYTPGHLFNTALHDNTAVYFAENQVEMQKGADTEQIIASYVEEIDKIYDNTVRMPGLNLIAKTRGKVRTMAMAGIAFVFLAAVILTVVLLKLHRDRLEGLRYVAYASGGCALMSFVVPFALYRSKFYTGIHVTPQYFYSFVVSYIRNLLLSFLHQSVFWGLFTVLCIAAISIMQNDKWRNALAGKLGQFVRRPTAGARQRSRTAR